MISIDTWANLAIAIFTVVGVATSIWFGVISQRQNAATARQDAERAEAADRASQAAAERAENASALTIDTMGRIADAVERISEQGPATPGILPGPAQAKWRLSHSRGDLYRLENAGEGAAHQVTATTHESMYGVRDLPADAEFAPGEAIEFMALRSGSTTDSTITVTWVGDDGDEHVWRYPLPARPPRRR